MIKTLQKYYQSLDHRLTAAVLLAQSQFGDGFSDPVTDSLLSGNDSAEGHNALSNLELLVSRMIGALTTLAGIAFIIYFVMGAFKWVTAGGDSSKVQTARDQMVQGVLGLVVVIGAYSLIGIVGSVVGIDILNPADQLSETFGLSGGAALGDSIVDSILDFLF